MARTCEICGKKPIVGMNVSHANNRTKKWLRPNLHSVRAIIEGVKRHYKICSKCLKAGKFTKVTG